MTKEKYKTKFQVYVTEERRDEIDEAVEEGNWSSRSGYLRHVIRAGESNIAELDPRTDKMNSEEQRRGSTDGEFVSDEELIQELRTLTQDNDGEFVDLDAVINTFLKELESELTDRVFQMSQDPSSAVETDKRGGYKVE